MKKKIAAAAAFFLGFVMLMQGQEYQVKAAADGVRCGRQAEDLYAVSVSVGHGAAPKNWTLADSTAEKQFVIGGNQKKNPTGFSEKA